ncbi:conserved exported hypothetical protein [Xanthomonas citri pv. fuscans]|uniref:hypothetical protein n=1 Tax=Xanthomonas citri TaxID=346 RepID=UPI000C5583C9|nr:hypothetical protein [Xanthomonas citri]QTF19427.1 hypothetical protein XcfCFBP6992P_23340 [Xanthomonas citri pv. phaseoli var. fuscans]QTF76498.1 hypothetical protein XcfCFBP6994P_22970 [Xanthomonas citri pv. phaseoli var. fuscans]QTF76714.1 hypothetical protein XcfCFBP6996P_22655 [Xanthomonas citri pv. phaseoli var. fuscans]SOO20089.1 conserved exported hypothetical protein [Xanthomonas citri pv. fuscans]SOO31937.1 conserved exported hypothetical protein [Xanthomonas citri pv. fuscans]
MKTKWIFVSLIASLFFMRQEMASAQTWIVCSNCSTTAQFSASARSAHGSTWGSTLYGVVNPNNGEFMWVQVARQTGPAPLSIPEIKGDGFAFASVEELSFTTSSGIHVMGVRMSSDAPASSALKRDPSNPRAAGPGDTTVITLDATPVERQKIQDIVRISKSSVLLVPDYKTGYFNSYQEAYYSYHSALDSVIYAGLTINNPTWTDQSMGGLWKALSNFWGKGPVGCVIFLNGDTACFQINPMAIGASRVLSGTAKKIDGSQINISGDQPIPNGGTSVEVLPENPSPGQVTYAPAGGFTQPKMACVTVNKSVQTCRVIF